MNRQIVPQLPSARTFQAPNVITDVGADGAVLVRSGIELPPHPPSLPHMFSETAARYPARPFMRQRCGIDGNWIEITYKEALDKARAIAQWLLNDGAQAGDVVAILSGPSIEHALVMLGTQVAGLAAAPLSVAYSLLSTDHVRLKDCVAKVSARYVFADQATPFAKALLALREHNPGLRFILGNGTVDGIAAHPLDSLTAVPVTADVDRAMADVGPLSIARVMFTSGSTGSPKATPQTHKCMVVTVAQMEALGLLDFAGEGPQHLEAMPFSHIMAGNFNFNNVIRAGGTIHIDEGKPTPALISKTIANLREVSPHFFITVPAGYAMLCDAMENDAELRQSFFKNLRYIGFGGALMPDHVAARLRRMAHATRGEEVPIFSFYGATEFLFGALQYWNSPNMHVIGLPLPQVEMKLAPVDGKHELRVRSPALMPYSGYIGESIPHGKIFDADGFYRTGDAVRWCDPARPEEGLVFDGRIAEEFKLISGTFVCVAPLRSDLLSACGSLVQEIVICGLNEEWIGALIWLNEPVARQLAGDTAAGWTRAQLARTPAVTDALKRHLARHNAGNPGSSRQVRRALVMSEPLSYDANEVTDKGTASQMIVRTRRAADVRRLYQGAAAPDLIDL